MDFERLYEICKNKEKAVVCIITKTRGSTPRKIGAKMIVFDDGSEFGKVEGSVGGGAIENEVRVEALKSLSSGKSNEITISTGNVGMCCGGQVTVYLEPVLPRPKCFIFGGGHIGKNVYKLAKDIGFSVAIIDSREDYLNKNLIQFAGELIHYGENFNFENLLLGSDIYVVIATHSHQQDREIAENVLKFNLSYLGIVGSSRKASMLKLHLKSANISFEKINSIICPAGINIGAETPEEIAVSIVSQIIEVKNRGG